MQRISFAALLVRRLELYLTRDSITAGSSSGQEQWNYYDERTFTEKKKRKIKYSPHFVCVCGRGLPSPLVRPPFMENDLFEIMLVAHTSTQFIQINENGSNLISRAKVCPCAPLNSSENPIYLFSSKSTLRSKCYSCSLLAACSRKYCLWRNVVKAINHKIFSFFRSL